MEIKKQKISFSVIGETNDYTKSPLKSIFLSLDEAKKLGCFIEKYLGILPVKIKYSNRKTKHVMATYNEEFIRIYKGNNSVHILLHEFAHTKCYNHSLEWKKTFKKLIRQWNSDWCKNFN